MNKIKSSGKGTELRNSLAWCFGLMFFTWAIFTFSIDVESYTPKAGMVSSVLLLLLATANVVTVFVLSIQYLRKFREKGLAVTSLVFSSIFLLIVFGAFSLLFGG